MKRLVVLLVALVATSVPSNAQTRINSFSLEIPFEAQSQPPPKQGVKFVAPFDLNIANRDSSSSNIADAEHRELKRRIVEAASISLEQSIEESLARIEQEPSADGDTITQPLSISAEPAGTSQKRVSEIAPNGRSRFHWGPAIKQSLLFLAVQHGYAMTQPKTRRHLRGPFLKDYFGSLANLNGWDDGGRFFTNYIAHPMQGSLTGFIQIHNDPKGMKQEFGRSKSYWKSRLKAAAWSAAWSTQFELGPISQASIGNVGKSRKLTYEDLVITPTAGVALLVTEDAMDRYVVRWVEGKTNKLYVRIPIRMLLNPTRSLANLLRFKKPWHRDTR